MVSERSQTPVDQGGEPTFDELSTAISAALTGDGAELARLLRWSRTLDPYFDERKEYIHLDSGAFFSLSRGFSIADACAKIVEGAKRHSVKRIARALASFLATGTFPVITVHLVKGPRIADDITLDAGCRLVPYATAIDIFGESLTDSRLDHRIPLDGYAPACGLLLTTALRPGTDPAMHGDAEPAAATHQDPGRATRPEYEGIAKFGPDFICAMLGVVTRRPLYPFCHTQIVGNAYSDALPMLPPGGGLSVTNIEFSIFPTRDVLTNAGIDKDELVSLVSAFVEASEDVQRYLTLPIVWFRAALAAAARHEHVDRCITLWVAFEALFKTQKKEEVVKRAARICSDVFPDAKKRIEEFYDQRTRIIHCRPFTERVELANKAEDVLITCIKRVIIHQRVPDWTGEQPLEGA